MESLLIIGALLVLLLLRVPVAFAMGALGVLLLWLKEFPLIAVPQRLFGSMDSFELLAVPLFLLMSNVLRVRFCRFPPCYMAAPHLL